MHCNNQGSLSKTVGAISKKMKGVATISVGALNRKGRGRGPAGLNKDFVLRVLSDVQRQMEDLQLNIVWLKRCVEEEENGGLGLGVGVGVGLSDGKDNGLGLGVGDGLSDEKLIRPNKVGSVQEKGEGTIGINMGMSLHLAGPSYTLWAGHTREDGLEPINSRSQPVSCKA